MEIRKDVLDIIRSDKRYKQLLGAYKKLDFLIKKNPVENFIKIRSQAENFLKYYKDAVNGRPIKTIETPDTKPVVKKVNKDNLNKRTVRELREICKQKGIKAYTKDNKTTLIKKIRNMLESENQNNEINIQEIDKELNIYTQSLKTHISQWKENFRKYFLTNLEKLLKEKEFELKGKLPVLKTWIFSFKIDFESQYIPIWYGPEQEKVAKSKLDYIILAETIEKYYKHIVNRELDDLSYLEKLYRAYEVSLFKEGKKIGDQVSVIDLLLDYIFLIQNNKYKANPRKEFYTDYPRYLFSYDLYRLKRRKYKNFELTPIIATRAYTKKQSDFIWIPTNEKGDGNYISHFKFREINYE